MKITHEIFMEQQQKLIITPELRQAIAVLQMSALELQEHINRELAENPFLEERDEEGEEEKEDREELAADEDKIEEWLEYYHDRDIGINVREKEEYKNFENYITRQPSLYEHLHFQLSLALKDPEDLEIGDYIIGNIDNNGYLTVSVEEIASHLNQEREKVEKVLKVIQTFSPYGVGARDLAECLLLQLMHYGKESSLARAIIQNHLDDVARGRINKIAQKLGVSQKEVQDICDLIRTLDPRPGLQYSNNEEIKYVVPDVLVEKIEGEYVVIINDINFPRLMINHVYEEILRSPENFSPETKKYLEEKMGSALWLIKSIEQRRMTLYKVARCIVDRQKEFLDKGIAYLKPLTLKQVAEMVNVHESTVSRAVANKYMQTPQGLFELKFFFSSGLQAGGEEKVSSTSIKHMLHDIIAGEDSSHPLSDEAITKILEEKGIKISRRTVAKYRQELGIPPAVSRKRY
ncbi:RNA polymerase, sigma 54 subunit, RpoN/SigL [Thermosyntropha lipolytica DSM 11003]|uniref:RNA polymerase, sigma 54 subunit, RpoN/SigL n=1 Tax=Thermosyntropha lipolytica DSM 11003 TaxID=1123382 RepID=A0A1M5KKW4_9FIRM|nr:RNA polymerase factor sigma-54 [Thermosyntropha lipolytica]SHG53300.1 RNA polymerase, sigma 54 subunit, RpoN/SigL [Thermosyntropha lipolytica DSM 11003]